MGNIMEISAKEKNRERESTDLIINLLTLEITKTIKSKVMVSCTIAIIHWLMRVPGRMICLMGKDIRTILMEKEIIISL